MISELKIKIVGIMILGIALWGVETGGALGAIPIHSEDEGNNSNAVLRSNEEKNYPLEPELLLKEQNKPTSREDELDNSPAPNKKERPHNAWKIVLAEAILPVSLDGSSQFEAMKQNITDSYNSQEHAGKNDRQNQSNPHEEFKRLEEILRTQRSLSEMA